jgi:uncharacterized protein YkwD
MFARRSLLVLFMMLALLISALWLAPAQAEQIDLHYLPLVTTPKTPAQRAADRINFYRQLAGVPLLQLHSALLVAAQSHAAYDLLNHSDPSAWTAGPHGEVAGKPGFSGESSGARAIAAGYPWAAGWEVIDYYDDPTRGVDDLMNSVFHRAGILAWSHQYMGYGHGHSASEAVDVIDFGRGPAEPISATGVLVFPADGQTDIPLYGASETPDPLPPEGRYPIGYPITVQPAFGTALVVELAALHSANDTPLRLYPNPVGCGTSCYALLPIDPLQRSTTYSAHVRGTVDDVPFDKTWSFTTTDCMYRLDDGACVG